MTRARSTNRTWWSTDDEATLRRLYPSAPMTDVLAAFPRRTLGGVKKHARKLGLSRPQFWTPAEEARLREMWPDCARRTIERAIGRDWDAIKQHASKLGLTAKRDGTGDASRWAGYVSATRAAEVAGVDAETFFRVVARYQEHFKGIDPEARKALAAPALCARGELLDSRRHLVIDEMAARDAMAWWDSLESAPQAAARLGILYRRLNRHARKVLGVELPKGDRRPAAWWDDLERRAVETWRARWLSNMRRGFDALHTDPERRARWLASVRKAAAERGARERAARPGTVRALPAASQRKAAAS